MRKFPINYTQYKLFRGHQKLIRHGDTTLWFWQVFTGFALFFLASVHLYMMLTRPHLIGPFESADRVWTDNMWPLYILLLLAVEMHGGIGLYRLAVKWGWFAGSDANATRKRLKTLKWAITVFFLVLGFATLAAYIKIGIEHAPKYGRALRSDAGCSTAAGSRQMKIIYTDVLVIGGGLAGPAHGASAPSGAATTSSSCRWCRPSARTRPRRRAACRRRSAT